MGMTTTTSLADARSQLSRYVDAVERTHERVTITKNGKVAAVLINADDLESLEETLYWASQDHVDNDDGEAVDYHAVLQEAVAAAEAAGDADSAGRLRRLAARA